MVQLLSLDLATRLGWSFGDTEAGDPVSGSFKLPSTGEEIGLFLAAYHNWLIETLKTRTPDLITFEAPVPMTGKTSMSTIMKLWGLCSHTEFVAEMKDIECRQVPVSSWKSAIVGTNRFSKPTTKKQAEDYPVIRVLRERGFDHVIDDNEADAIAIWLYSVRLVSPGKEARFDPLMRAGSFSYHAA